MFTSWLVLLLLLSSYNSTYAIISDNVFEEFCTSIYLVFPGGLEPQQRVGNETCTQLVPFYSDNEGKRIQICKKFAPFEVISAVIEGKATKCTWTQPYTCRDDEKLLNKKCLTKTSAGTFEQVNKICGDNLYRAGDLYETRWIIKLFSPGGNNIWIANTPEYSRAFLPKRNDIGYARSNFDYGSNYKHLSIMANHDWEIGITSGVWITTNPEELLISFCSRTARRVFVPPATTTSPTTPPTTPRVTTTTTPTTVDNKPKPTQAVVTTSTIKQVTSTNTPYIDRPPILFPAVKSMTIFRLNRDLGIYLTAPFAFSKVHHAAFVLDVKEMYDVCLRYSIDSFPLIPTKEYIRQYAQFIKSPAFVLGFMGEVDNNIDGCPSSANGQSLSQKFMTFDRNHKKVLIDRAMWERGFPRPRCARQPPVAVVLNNNGRLENFPVAARLPIVCGIGVQPNVPDIDICTSPNTELGADGNCHCSAGFVEVPTGSRRGLVCQSPNPCAEYPGRFVFNILVDETGTSDDVIVNGRRQRVRHFNERIIPFVRKVIDTINGTYQDKLWGNFLRFSRIVIGQSIQNPYKDFVVFKPPRYNIPRNIYKAAGYPRHDHQHSPRLLPWYQAARKVTVFVTDGPLDHSNLAIDQFNGIKSYGGDSRVIMVSIGKGIEEHYRRILVSDYPQDSIVVEDLYKIMDYYNTLMARICPPRSQHQG